MSSLERRVFNVIGVLAIGLVAFTFVVLVRNLIDGNRCEAAHGAWVGNTCIDRSAVIKP